MLLHRLEVMQFGHLLVIIMKLFVIMERHRVFETAAFLMREMAKSSIDYNLGFYSPTKHPLYTHRPRPTTSLFPFLVFPQ